MSAAHATAQTPAPQLSWNGEGPVKLAVEHSYADDDAPPEQICSAGSGCTECQVHDDSLCPCAWCDLYHRARQWSFDRDARLALAAELQPLIDQITDEDMRLYHEHDEFCVCAACEVSERSAGRTYSREFRLDHAKAHQEWLAEPKMVLIINPDIEERAWKADEKGVWSEVTIPGGTVELVESTPANRKAIADSWTRSKEREEEIARELAELPTDVRECVLGFEDRGGHYDVESKDKFGLMRAFEKMGIALRFNSRAAKLEATDSALTWYPQSTFTPHPQSKMSAQLSAETWELQKYARARAHWIDFGGALKDYIHELLPRRFYFQTKNKDGDLVKTPLIFGKDKLNQALGAISYETEIDPLMEWLDCLPRWDGTQRLDSWMEAVFKLDPTPGNLALAEWASRFIVLGIVWRTFQPGTKLDEMPVPNGPGGIGKSTALAAVFEASVRDRYFTDGLKLTADPQRRVEATQGRALVEVSEMHGVAAADADSLNSYLSQTNDGAVRLAYRQDPVPTPRRFIIVGTSHKPTFLPNDMNLRRYVPVTLLASPYNSAAGVTEFWDEYRVQLWAEAVHLYHQGVTAHLPNTLKPLQKAATAQVRRRDLVIEDAVAAWVEPQPGGWRSDFTIAELAFGVGLAETIEKATQMRMADQHRLGDVLGSLGYDKTRKRDTHGRRQYFWYKKAEADDAAESQ